MHAKRIVILVLTVCALTPFPDTNAATKHWKNSVGSGDFNVNPNWSAVSAAGADNGGVPLAGDGVRINHSDGVARIVTLTGSAPSLGLLTIDQTGPGTTANTLALNGEFTLMAAAMLVGGHNGVSRTNGRGAVTHSTGDIDITAGGDLTLGDGAGSTGTYTLSGGKLAAAQSEFIGLFGNGTFNHSGGTNTINVGSIGSFIVGTFAGSTGTYNLSGTGQLISHKDEYIGYEGAGFFNQTGGSNTIRHPHVLYLGHSVGGTGTYTLSAGALTVETFHEYIGFNGAGTFNQSGGTNTMNGDLVIGAEPGSTGAYNQTGGTTTCQELFLGTQGATGTYHLSGAALLTTVSALVQGTMEITGGGTMLSSATTIGRGAGGVASAIVRGPGSSLTSSNGIILSGAGGGALEITDGGRVTTVGAIGTIVGNLSNSIGSVTVSGAGSALNSDSLKIGESGGTGTVTIKDQGVVNLNGLLIRANSTLNFQGGVLRFVTYDRHPTATLNFQAGTIQLAGDRFLGADAAIAEFFGSSPTIPLSKGLTVEGAASISAGVAMAGGRLQANTIVVHASGSITGFGTVSTPHIVATPLLNNGHIAGNSAAQRITLPGYVKGIGTFDQVNFAGTFSPGLSPFTSLVGSVSFSPTSLLVMEIGSTSPGNQYDRILSSGQLGFGGTLQVALINGFAPSVGQSYNLFDWNTSTGTFDVLNLPSLAGSLVWDTAQLYATGVISVVSSDFNGDGSINHADLARWNAGFGTGSTPSQGDANGDADVDGADFLTWQQQFGHGPGNPPTSPVPEPVSLSLAAALAIALLIRGRQSPLQ